MSTLLPRPTVALVKEVGKRFDNDSSTSPIEIALTKLIDKFPQNADLADVLLKVTTINGLYSTNIYSLVALARHIWKLDNIDAMVSVGDTRAVELIAKIQFKGDQKDRHLYSFASKYCSWHNQKDFPIYDSRARNTLWKYRKQDRFYHFSSDDVWCYHGYAKFCEIVEAFRDNYGLKDLNFKSIDKFLYWLDVEGSYC
jgi:hypothetical protein